MVGETPTGIDLLAPVGEVRVLAVLLRAAAGEVLARARHAARTERIPLEALEIRDSELRHEVGVLAERAGLARPARLGREVERRVQRGPDADGDVLLPRDVGEASHRVRVAQRREPERLGPLRERPGGEGDPDVLDERVPRVGRHRHGYAVRRALGERLQGVAPAGRRCAGRRGRGR